MIELVLAILAGPDYYSCEGETLNTEPIDGFRCPVYTQIEVRHLRAMNVGIEYFFDRHEIPHNAAPDYDVLIYDFGETYTIVLSLDFEIAETQPQYPPAGRVRCAASLESCESF